MSAPVPKRSLMERFAKVYESAKAFPLTRVVHRNETGAAEEVPVVDTATAEPSMVPDTVASQHNDERLDSMVSYIAGLKDDHIRQRQEERAARENFSLFPNLLTNDYFLLLLGGIVLNVIITIHYARTPRESESLAAADFALRQEAGTSAEHLSPFSEVMQSHGKLSKRTLSGIRQKLSDLHLPYEHNFQIESFARYGEGFYVKNFSD